ncbi:MAG: TetR/AcrR family transcriptional regulator [Acidimicrobiales bacterium]
MLEEPISDRRTKRHEATRREIVAAAWDLARENGLAGVSLRDLGKRVGMQAPSLYSYFPSKAAIYDAMFGEAARAFLERLQALELPLDPKRRLLSSARAFVEFCVEDPVRYQLLFQRTIPDFEPSAESYATAIATLELGRDLLAAAGITDPGSLDLWTALLTGIVDQQLSNDPGGERWTRLLPDAVDMFLAHRKRRRR